MATISNSALVLDSVRALYDRGLYVQAHAEGASLGDLANWPGTEGRILAARLAGNLGAGRLSAALHTQTWRRNPNHQEATLYYVFVVSNRRGPWFAWNAHSACGEFTSAPPDLHADWLALRGRLAAMLRDFDTAERWIDRALKVCDDRPWPWVERSTSLQLQDRYTEALDSARRALTLWPYFRPAVQHATYLLQLLNRGGQALELLEEAAAVLESGDVVMQLAAAQMECQMYPEARANWERAEELLILKDKEYQKLLAARRSDAAYHCGDEADCLRWAEKADQHFFKAMAARLERAPVTAKRVSLPVGFVRQHHMTCAPATLTALSNYWGKSALHLEIAEKICYDGTPSHSQRQWAEQYGFVTREFSLTWEAAVKLIDCGVPFTITTVEPGNAHLQAVIGYDARRGTLLIRDPTFPSSGEGLAQEIIDRYSSTGPRCMLMIPPDKIQVLADWEPLEASLYDRLYRLEVALQKHDRPAAVSELSWLETSAGGHRITILARRILANYDGNLVGMLAAAQDHLKLFPNDVNAQLFELSLLAQLSRRDNRLQRLNSLAQPQTPIP